MRSLVEWYGASGYADKTFQGNRSTRYEFAYVLSQLILVPAFSSITLLIVQNQIDWDGGAGAAIAWNIDR